MTLADLSAALTQGLSKVVLTGVMALRHKQREPDLDAHPCRQAAGVVLRKGPFETKKKAGKKFCRQPG